MQSIKSSKRFKLNFISLLDLINDYITNNKDKINGFKQKHYDIFRLYIELESSYDLITNFINRSFNHWNALREKNISYLISHVDILVDKKYIRYMSPIINIFSQGNIINSYYDSFWNHTHAAIRICIHH